jgi:hypothetical protein
MGVELQGNSQAGFRTDTSSEPAAGLSVGAKVGITLGAVLGFAFFLGAAVIFFLRRHKKATQSATPEGRTEPVQELPGYSSGLRKFSGEDGEQRLTERRSARRWRQRKCTSCRCPLPSWKRCSISNSILRTLRHPTRLDRISFQQFTKRRTPSIFLKL